jgi:TctA family transporter
MHVSVKLSALSEGHWYEFAIRFLLGSVTTVSAGIIAAVYGPAVGGLFLAFPAIFPASATLVEKHQRERKEKAGLKGERRGKEAAALEAAGAALGSVGLMAFGAVVWLVIPVAPALAVLLACLVWFGVSVLLWILFRHVRVPRHG